MDDAPHELGKHIKTIINVACQVLNNMDDMKDANFELCSMAVKDLTMRQLQSLQVRSDVSLLRKKLKLRIN